MKIRRYQEDAESKDQKPAIVYAYGNAVNAAHQDLSFEKIFEAHGIRQKEKVKRQKLRTPPNIIQFQTWRTHKTLILSPGTGLFLIYFLLLPFYSFFALRSGRLLPLNFKERHGLLAVLDADRRTRSELITRVGRLGGDFAYQYLAAFGI